MKKFPKMDISLTFERSIGHLHFLILTIYTFDHYIYIGFKLFYKNCVNRVTEKLNSQ